MKNADSRRASREFARAKLAGLADSPNHRRWLIVGIVAVVLVGVVILAVAALENVRGHAAPQPTASAADYTPVACTSKELKADLAPSGSAAGLPVTFKVTLTNTSSDHPCTIDAGWSNLGVVVKSGGQQVGDTAQCQAGTQGEHDMLLLDRAMSATVAVQWPGRVDGSGCGASGSPAMPGTYSAVLALKDGSAADATTGFALTAGGVAPAPIAPAEPAPSPEPTAATATPQGGAEGADANGTAPADSLATAPAGTPSAGNSLPPSQ